MPNSFFNNSPFNGPTPLRYSMGLDNMVLPGGMKDYFYKYIRYPGNAGSKDLQQEVGN
ncbi:MAG: hypothetical protein WKI04_08275 [Ferruginibacter sp.]